MQFDYIRITLYFPGRKNWHYIWFIENILFL